MTDPQFYGDIKDRLAKALSSGVQDVLPTGTRTQKQADRLGMMVDPNYMQKMTDVGLAGMTVFHGSPYKFDKFDMSKIGTGEGAQMYGHGLYFAENPNVSRQYAENVKDNTAITQANQEMSTLAKTMSKYEIPGQYRKYSNPAGNEAAQRYDELMALRQQKVSDPGNLYRVDLPDEHIAKMLDWDKPLNKQAVYEQLKQSIPYELMPNGSKSVRDLISNLGGDAAAAEKLRAAGIPGIRYLDGGSRTGGAGTSNFVVFDDQLPKIMGRE